MCAGVQMVVEKGSELSCWGRGDVWTKEGTRWGWHDGGNGSIKEGKTPAGGDRRWNHKSRSRYGRLRAEAGEIRGENVLEGTLY